MNTLLEQISWVVPGLALLIVASVRFNNPPTNRSGTTFYLFHLGVVFYYALLIGIWFFVIVLLKGGGAALGELGMMLGNALKAPDQIAQFLPIFRRADNCGRIPVSLCPEN